MVITGNIWKEKESDGLCPNHVRNIVKIKGIPKDKINYVLNKLAMKYTTPKYAGETEEYIMDFDLIIPSPRFKKDCPKNCIVNKSSHIEKDVDRPWFDWYNWQTTYWGTKWNAYDGYTKIGKTQLTFVFNTAWCTPSLVYSKLCAWCDEQGYDLEIRYADESIGNNCGMITLDASEHDLNHYHNGELTNPVRFARYIWNNY